ncbi:MarR family transcriptional regulator [Demequina sp. TTPB684]|uniref:MarR family winged helix-turn-helix transcriptional regulator n=1 Tax=unclassified Demequina TaxID=2620311 RepID=UPI001CF296E3|nr:MULTISPECIES: MarR family transcriptional regulator [unclassified Demequina]MCB2411657.1 MarR family transcriptional regulator [Demequina sp. TTPB684]UPU88043.1 MarR family transcriptional regulator [Demequina sp. TMPB413]
MADHVDLIVEQWRLVRPDLDPSPIAVFGRLSRLSRAAEARMNENFAHHDMDRSAFDVLVTLRRNGEPYRLTSRELQSAAMVSSAAVAQRLNRLEERGWVRRSTNADDARVTDVVLTEEGFVAVERAMPDHVAAEAAMLASLTPAEREELARLLARVLQDVGAG